MTAAQTLFKGICQAGLVTAEPAKLIAFYRDTLGCPLLFEAGGMSFLQAGATSVMVGGAPERPARDVILYFEPNDWNEAEARLTAAGVAFGREAQVVQRHGEREHLLRPFQDPEGRPLYLLGWREATAR